METLTSQKVIDSAIVKAALEFYTRHLAPDIKQKVEADLKRLINEYAITAKTPLTYDDDGCLIVAPDDSKEGRKVNINDL